MGDDFVEIRKAVIKLCCENITYSNKSKYQEKVVNNTINDAVECITSFHQAMQDAGGKILDFDVINSMTLLEFITTIAAQNKIRFIYDRKDKI